jgi:hypothetical protein
MNQKAPSDYWDRPEVSESDEAELSPVYLWLIVRRCRQLTLYSVEWYDD